MTETITEQVKKTALITGSGRGLGAAIAGRLLDDGFRVVITDIDQALAEQTAKALDPSGEKAMALKLDVCQKQDFVAAVEAVSDAWGGLSVLVNNAGMTKTTPIFEIEADEFDQVMAINLRGTFLGCQVAGRHFADQGYGRIINMASLAAQNGGAATGAHYAASKGGIVTLTKVFARDLAANGVTVNAISPGPLDVDLVHEILSPETVANLKTAIPVGHLGNPDFIGDLVVMLASEKAASMTGSTLDANGGLYVR